MAHSGESRSGASGGFGELGPGRRFGIVPIEKKGADLRVHHSQHPAAGPWDEPGESRATLLRLFKGWHPPIQALLEAMLYPATQRNHILHRMPVRNGERRGSPCSAMPPIR